MLRKSFYNSWCYCSNAIAVPIFAITYRKRYVPVVTLSSNDHGKLFKKEAIKNWFKRRCNWNTYRLTDTLFQRVNGLFVSSFKVEACWRSYKQYLLPSVEVKDDNVMIEGKKFSREWFFGPPCLKRGKGQKKLIGRAGGEKGEGKTFFPLFLGGKLKFLWSKNRGLQN